MPPTRSERYLATPWASTASRNARGWVSVTLAVEVAAGEFEHATWRAWLSQCSETRDVALAELALMGWENADPLVVWEPERLTKDVDVALTRGLRGWLATDLRRAYPRYWYQLDGWLEDVPLWTMEEIGL